jgi:hypothetical protein
MPGDKSTTAAIIRFIESLGYAVSVHHMREYVEMHAILLKDPDAGYHLARNGDGDNDEIIRISYNPCALRLFKAANIDALIAAVSSAPIKSDPYNWT